MTFDLSNAVVYDIETFPNAFTLAMEMLNSGETCVWEISEFRDDRQQLFQWLQHLAACQIPMIGFNSISYDYPLLHHLWKNPNASVAEIYDKSQAIIKGDKFGHMIWASDRFAPQIDLFRINHFDNKAKTTSLKALQVNMRAESVVESALPWGKILTREEIEQDLIPYNKHDVKETKRFAGFNKQAIEFRVSLIGQFGIDVLNFNDTKIGAKMMEQRLGDDLCFTRVPRWDGDNYGRKVPRQTIRNKIPLADVIFPYVQFRTPELNRVLDYMKAQTLTPDDIDDPDGAIKTKGVFSGLSALVGGVEFHYGTGGVHGSVKRQRFVADENWLIRDIDVASLYPSIAIVNRLAPEHLGSAFIDEYSKMPTERKEWQKKKGKKCVEANSIKLASNGVYGNSNNKFSWMLDPKYTMTTTINGQLMLSMLAEWLLDVPTFHIIQINTDGITYYIHKDYEPQAAATCEAWQKYTLLVLEDVNYSRMFIRDVNSYIAEDTDGGLKLKGAYWTPDPLRYGESISEQQPPAWHKDLGNFVSTRAAVAAMVQGWNPEQYIRLQSDPFDFMLRVRAQAGSTLVLGGQEIQKTTRYYVANQGAPMVKRMPAAGPIGWAKKANGVPDALYTQRMQETGGEWHPDVCTKNKSRYEIRETGVESGWNVAECNDVRSFNWQNVNYNYYAQESAKLII